MEGPLVVLPAPMLPVVGPAVVADVFGLVVLPLEPEPELELESSLLHAVDQTTPTVTNDERTLKRERESRAIGWSVYRRRSSALLEIRTFAAFVPGFRYWGEAALLSAQCRE